MTDINQWRRRIQPIRSRTPILPGEHDGMQSETVHNLAPSRKKSRPKLSAYLTHYIPSTKHHPFLDDHIGLVDSPSFSTNLWTEDCGSDFDQIMDSVMRMLMAEPYRPLDIRHNTSILMIFETFRALRDRNAILIEKLGQEVEARYSAQVEIENTSKKWLQEKEEYRTEVKRLELVIARGKAGLAGVAQARQDSVLRRSHKRLATTAREDHMETVFEFLERTRTEDEAAKRAHRALFRNRPVSPSYRMAALSNKISTTDVGDSLLDTSSGDFEEPTTLSEASYFETMSSQPSLLGSLDQDNVYIRSAEAGPSEDTSASVYLHPRPGCLQSHRDSENLTTSNPFSTPILASPPILESSRLSMIPSPVFDASLARPRREDSASSFLTAIRASHTGQELDRTTSTCSNLHTGHRGSSRDNGLGASHTGEELSRTTSTCSNLDDGPGGSSRDNGLGASHTGEELGRTTSTCSNLDNGHRGSSRDNGTLATVQRPNDIETGIRGSDMVHPAVVVANSPTTQRSTAQLSPPQCTSHTRRESMTNERSRPKPFEPDGRLGEH